MTNVMKEPKILRFQVRLIWYLGQKKNAVLFGFLSDDKFSSAINLSTRFHEKLMKFPQFYYYNQRFNPFQVNYSYQKPHVIITGIDDDLEDNELNDAFHYVFESVQMFPDYMHILRDKTLIPSEDLKPEDWIEKIRQKFDLSSNENINIFFSKNETKFKKELNIEFFDYEDFQFFQEKHKEKFYLNAHKVQMKFLFKWEFQLQFQIFSCIIDKFSELQKKILIRSDRKASLLYYHYQIEEASKDLSMRPTVTLLVEGEDMAKVKWAVQEVKFLIEGQIFPEKDPKKLSFFLSEEGTSFIKTIYEKSQVFIELDQEKSILKLYGEDKQIETVKKVILEKILSLTSEFKIISLKGKNILSLVMNKLAKWNELYESFSTKLEIMARFSKKEIRINGPPDQILLFEKELYLHISNNPSSSQVSIQNAEICGICYGEITEYFLLELCRHRFCQICLKEMVDSATNDISLLPLRCLTCKCPISLQDINEIARVEYLPLLYKRSLELFMQENKEKYRFCPSPDCGQVLRLPLENISKITLKNFNKSISCDACKRVFCLGCWKPDHPGVSCESDLDLETMKKFNLRICPKCKLVIQKISGCNHMHCKKPYGCDSHLCWECGEYLNQAENAMTI